MSGLISSDTVWTEANSPYHIIGNTTLMTGRTLTIQAGTVVKFANNTWLEVRGFHNVTGNVSNRVVFTNKDPLYNYSSQCFERRSRYTYNSCYSGINFELRMNNGGKAEISFAKFENSSDQALSGANYINDTIFRNNFFGASGGSINRCTFENNEKGADGFNIYDSTFKDSTYGAWNCENIYNRMFINNTCGAYNCDNSYNCLYLNNTSGSSHGTTAYSCDFIGNEYGGKSTGNFFSCNFTDNTFGSYDVGVAQEEEPAIEDEVPKEGGSEDVESVTKEREAKKDIKRWATKKGGKAKVR